MIKYTQEEYDARFKIGVKDAIKASDASCEFSTLEFCQGKFSVNIPVIKSGEIVSLLLVYETHQVAKGGFEWLTKNINESMMWGE